MHLSHHIRNQYVTSRHEIVHILEGSHAFPEALEQFPIALRHEVRIELLGVGIVGFGCGCGCLEIKMGVVAEEMELGEEFLEGDLGEFVGFFG